MKSRATRHFWKCYGRLPLDIQQRSRKAYQLWRKNPHHPSLHFKRVRETLPLYSVRVTDSYRVLGVLEDDTMIWQWIGTHDDYEALLK